MGVGISGAGGICAIGADSSVAGGDENCSNAGGALIGASESEGEPSADGVAPVGASCLCMAGAWGGVLGVEIDASCVTGLEAGVTIGAVREDEFGSTLNSTDPSADGLSGGSAAGGCALGGGNPSAGAAGLGLD